MKSRPSIKLVAVTGLVIVTAVLSALGGKIYLNGQKDSDEKPSIASNTGMAQTNGVPVVTVNPAAQLQSGIRTALLTPVNYRQEIIAYGSALDLQPLIDYRSRFAAAVGASATARATAAASQAEYERNRTLYADNRNVSLKAVQTAQAAATADRAKAESAALNETDLRAAITQQFGKTLADRTLTSSSKSFNALLKREKTLLTITLPLGENLTPPAVINVSAYNQQRIAATLVEAAPQSDPVIPGRGYFYCADTAIPANTRIVAYLPVENSQRQALFIPSGALVWYGGQPWVYIQLDKDRFARRVVPQQSPGNGGFYVTQEFKPGDAIVVRGAQLLLSEEFRAQIKTGEEGDDDD
ncbi:MAG: efflux RND transporter periplasmic adaptor subunit [Burkholderiales bacterium]